MVWVDPELQDIRNMLVRWSIALLYTTKCHLRQDGDIEEDLEVQVWSCTALLCCVVLCC